MKTQFISRIKWVSPENGGRKKIPPKGTRYCPLIKLGNNEDEEWSIDFICPDFTYTDIIEFSFLVSGAPLEKIVVENTYDLYEGNKKVAKVYIKKKK